MALPRPIKNPSELRAKRLDGKTFAVSEQQYSLGQILYLSNPAGSGVNLHIYRIAMSGSYGVADTVIYSTDKAVSGGTSITPAPLTIGGSASAANAGDGYTTASVTSTVLFKINGGNGCSLTLDLPEELIIPPDRAIYGTIVSGADAPRQSFIFFYYEEMI